MTQDAAIATALKALREQGFAVEEEANFAQIYEARETNEILTAMQVDGPGWVVVFPLKKPTPFRSHASIYVDDGTGAACAAQAI